jgi:hypothetical protein
MFGLTKQAIASCGLTDECLHVRSQEQTRANGSSSGDARKPFISLLLPEACTSAGHSCASRLAASTLEVAVSSGSSWPCAQILPVSGSHPVSCSRA